MRDEALEAGQNALSDHLGGRQAGDAEPRFVLVRSTPLVEGALAHLVAREVRPYWGADHSLFLGQAEYARSERFAPLLFRPGRYEWIVREPRAFSTIPDEVGAQTIRAFHRCGHCREGACSLHGRACSARVGARRACIRCRPERG